jgi:hypothetical protein
MPPIFLGGCQQVTPTDFTIGKVPTAKGSSPLSVVIIPHHRFLGKVPRENRAQLNQEISTYKTLTKQLKKWI